MVDPDASTPLFRQVAGIIADRIRSGELKPGRPIPSEEQLRQEFGVARGTARKAVALLRQHNQVHTVPGRGTFVGPAPVDPMDS